MVQNTTFALGHTVTKFHLDVRPEDGYRMASAATPHVGSFHLLDGG